MGRRILPSSTDLEHRAGVHRHPLFGGFIGLILSNLFPQRMISEPTIPGISLLLSPLATGMVMKLFGDWRRSRGHHPTVLATFLGGALFAFSMALVRWLRVSDG